MRRARAGTTGGAASSGERRVCRELCQARKKLGQLARQIFRQVARVGARVGQDLVTLVERLRGLERARRAQPVATVGRALQRRQIEEQGRRLARNLLRHPLDDRSRRVRRRRVCARAHRHLVRKCPLAEAGCAALARVGGRRPLCREGVAAVGRICRRHERSAQLPVVARLERADRLVAPDDDRQRRRLHATDGVDRRLCLARRACAAEADGDRAGRVHADQPVGLRAAAGRIGQRIVLGAGAQPCEAVPDRLFGQRRDPEPPHREPAVRQLVDVAEDELALAARVAAVHDL